MSSMNLINENKLKHYIKEKVELETKTVRTQLQNCYDNLNQCRDELQSVKHQLWEAQDEISKLKKRI